MNRIPISDQPIPIKFINATNPLTLVTYDGSGETVHPCVIDIGTGKTFAGYRFWMVNTPYPNNDDTKENPSIWCSNDGTTWVIPDGLTNPVVAAPQDGYNSDPCLIYDPVLNKLRIYYRVSDTSNNDTIRMIESSDGVSWVNDTLLLSFDSNNRAVSPAVVYQSDGYTMWLVNLATPYYMSRYTSSDGVIWNLIGRVNFSILPAAYKMWHMDIKPYNGSFIGVMNCQVIADPANKAILLYFESIDGLVGNSFKVKRNLLKVSATVGAWDSTSLYKATLLNVDGTWTLWYCGIYNNSGTLENKMGLTSTTI